MSQSSKRRVVTHTPDPSPAHGASSTPYSALPLQWRVLAVGAVVMGTILVSMVVNHSMQPEVVRCADSDPSKCRAISRRNTLLSAGRSVFAVVVPLLGIFAGLAAAGLDVKALLASAGVIGLVVGLAAKSFLTSALAGVVLITSDKLSLGDLVQVDLNATTFGTGPKGLVEALSLQTVALRDVDTGSRHFISNGAIAAVTNFSQNPQRAAVNLHVAPSVAPAALLPSLEQFVSEDMARDPELAANVYRAPVLKGVTGNGEHSYTVTVDAMVEPTAHRQVERHMRERLLQFLGDAHVPASMATMATAK